jgi:hypothetical protein
MAHIDKDKYIVQDFMSLLKECANKPSKPNLGHFILVMKC